MGLSIHYNGRFNKNLSLSEMIEEVKDIAEIHNWKYTIFEIQFPEKVINSLDDTLYGICFSPPKCEPVWLCFLSNGRMSSPINLKSFGNSTDGKDKEYLYLLSTKTQYAGIEVHKLIIHFLKYISKKYFNEFYLADEGKYWETGDEKLLENIFNDYNSLMESFDSALKQIPSKPQENMEEYLIRILEMIHRKRKK